MPSAFIRKHVRGLLRNRLSPSSSIEASPDEDDPPTPSEPRSLLSQCHLAGIDGRRLKFPQVYCGKTGLDIPCIQLQSFDTEVFATVTGPDGGLTQVGEVRCAGMVRMANLDDEMSLSQDGFSSSEEDEQDEEEETTMSKPLRNKHKQRSEGLLGSCSSLLGPDGQISQTSKGADRFDWSSHDERRAFGMSISLYEKNPLTGVNAGDPIADVWGVVARNNNGVLALADGVNWGEGARLAARCAIRGSIDHLTSQIEEQNMHTTTDVFHELLAAFHSAHSLILQEGGLLTTLCVAVVVPAKHGNSWVLCVCNVGDSLCFVYNRNYGVREVTLGSHDIDQMRDMRDAGGALGPVDGRNPQLHNLTCSMTFVDEGDMVFITSDGVSDNFDPVVGKFCVIKRTESENKENNHLPPKETNRKISISTKDSGAHGDFARNRTCAASLPCIDAAQRHELMLVRMRDIIANGIEAPKETRVTSPCGEPLFSKVSSYTLCTRLIQFATQLSTAKRRTLENPELYKNGKMTKAEHRVKRKAVREKISEMPGKLDHASVVCYRVGWKDVQELPSPIPVSEPSTARINGNHHDDPIRTPCEVRQISSFQNIPEQTAATCSRIIIREDAASAELRIRRSSMKRDTQPNHPLYDIVEHRKDRSLDRPISPYEQLPVTSRDVPVRRRKHARGSTARHTLGVDVQWLKKLVGKKDDEDVPEEKEESSSSTLTSERGLSLRTRLRSLLGSSRNIASREEPRLQRPQALPVNS